ncbi:TPA: hypothetical protein N0F65_002698 [Lagenidium giganteum]|uniref:HTH psq-type domain-containing protein n=1 Tax=Lagenidium giganteum TaxID=4803 RepID=A0AAV2Z726_9STRA|nr:TPA: hypothetical protein N0F65_002698 [Lagenidium giganteum]
MPRSSTVDEEVWAKAVHAVNVQKMSFRQAAQLYGVHHMSLHRRVRGRYASTMASGSGFDMREYLSPEDEAEVLSVLREQFMHERRITSDDVRFVVRAVASQGGKRQIPAEFLPSRWIMEFKRVHGFVKLNNCALVRGENGDIDMGGDSESSDTSSTYSGHYAVPTFQAKQRPSDNNNDNNNRNDHRDEPSHSHNNNSNGIADCAATNGTSQSGNKRQRREASNSNNNDQGYSSSVEQNSDADREDLGSNTSSGSHDTGNTTTSSNSSYERETEKRSYKLSHTVPAETWEKAIAAVEQQGMSLRAAAKAYGVHFAALHRRVKKRAQGDQSTAVAGYFHPDDEAGIIRVVVARAELGVLMTFDELMDLVQRAALRNLPDISVESARKLMARFQTRNEHAIRHIIMDWPLPRLNPVGHASAVRVSSDFRPPRAPRQIVTVVSSQPSAQNVPPVPSSAGLPAPPAMQLSSMRIPPVGSMPTHHGPLPSLAQANAALRRQGPPPVAPITGSVSAAATTSTLTSTASSNKSDSKTSKPNGGDRSIVFV